MKDGKMLVVDGPNLLCRSYYGNKSLLEFNGHRTNGVTTFFRTLNSMLTPTMTGNGYTHLFIAWDVQSKYTWRWKLMNDSGLLRGDYKGGRLTVDREEILKQEVLVKRLLAAYSIRQNSSRRSVGDEADDLMATVAAHSGMPTDILTNDKDMLQLVDDTTGVIRPTYGHVSKKDVPMILGVQPNQVVDYLVMCGDSVDNIEGVKGIGHKTAVKLLEEFGSIDNVLKNLDKVTGRGKSAVCKMRDAPLQLLRKLIMLNTNAEDVLNLDYNRMSLDYIKDHYDKSRVARIKEELGMKSTLLTKLGA